MGEGGAHQNLNTMGIFQSCSKTMNLSHVPQIKNNCMKHKNPYSDFQSIKQEYYFVSATRLQGEKPTAKLPKIAFLF